MIESFHDKRTVALFLGQSVRSLPPEIQQRAFDKLHLLHASATLDDLRIPRSNALEKLTGDRKGQWSIRINDQWRICFRFAAGNAHDVEVADYH